MASEVTPRRQKTTVDYMIIAINPALIVAMIASLVYFLTLCFYRGELLNRMNYLLMLFIVASVGIARIAIEEGRERATLFALALGGATLISISRFIGDGLPLAVVLLAVIWLLADRITIDCTVIDEGDDASGEGLLQGGLFGGARTLEKRDVSLDGTTSSAGEQTDSGDSAAAVPGGINAQQTLTTRRKKRRQASRPGMWILYLAIAAIPLYGLGQIMVPDNRLATQRSILSLGIYLASSLMLLVTTSFLGLRRYLRQRGVDMPAAISINWLGVGSMIVVVLLVLSFFLPLPGSMLASVDATIMDTSESLGPSKMGWGNEGVDTDRQDVPGASGGEKPEKSKRQGDSGRDGEKNGSSKSGGGEGKDSDKKGGSGDSKQQDKQGKSSPGDSGKDGGDQQKQDKQSQSKNKKSGNQKPDKPSKKSAEREESEQEQSDSEQSKQSPSDQNKPDDEQSEQSESEQSQPREDQFESDEDESGSASQPPPQPDSSSASNSISNLLSKLAGLLRYLIFAVLAGIVIFYAMRHWDELVAWLRDLLGLSKEKEIEQDAPVDVAEPTIRLRRFSEFSNPLRDPRLPLEQAVVTTFAATIAWAREHGCPRGDDETPSEFAKRLGLAFPEMQRQWNALADMYNVVVYGNRKVDPGRREALAGVWDYMLRNARPIETPPTNEPPVLVGSSENEPPAPARWKT